MLGKLLKYELKSTSRRLGVIYLIILVLSLVIGISGRSLFSGMFTTTFNFDDVMVFNGIPFVIILITYFIFVVALAVITLVVIVERFYKNMLMREGYLMHTLPVPTWMLVASKTISALIWDVLGGAVIILSLVIIAVSGGVWKTIMTELSYLCANEYFAERGINLVVWLAALLIGSVRIILTFYVSMAIGGVAKKHKKSFSILVFICIMIVMQVITLISRQGIVENLGRIDNFGYAIWMFIHVLLLKGMVFDIVYGAVFFILTTFFLQKKLNLE